MKFQDSISMPHTYIHTYQPRCSPFSKFGHNYPFSQFPYWEISQLNRTDSLKFSCLFYSSADQEFDPVVFEDGPSDEEYVGDEEQDDSEEEDIRPISRKIVCLFVCV